MQIPKNLLQFEKVPALLLVSGEFKARFHLAKNGEINEVEFFELNPRDEAREKQAYVDAGGGGQALGAVSHVDRYVEDTKEKFIKNIGQLAEKITYAEKVGEIYVFCPAYFSKKITGKFNQRTKKLLKESYPGEHVDADPLSLIKMMQRQIQEKRSTEHVHLSQEERKIIHKPHTKPKKR